MVRQTNAQIENIAEDPILEDTSPMLILRRASTVQLPMSNCDDTPSPLQLKTSLSAPARVYANDLHTLLQSLRADRKEHVSKAYVEHASWPFVEKNATLPEQVLDSRAEGMSETDAAKQPRAVENVEKHQVQEECGRPVTLRGTKAPSPTSWEVPMPVATCLDEHAPSDALAKSSCCTPAPTAPGRTSASSLKATDLCEPGLLVFANSDCTHVHWAVPAQRLKRADRQVVSPVFALTLHGREVPFRVMLFPTPPENKGGFRNSGGRGRVALKCESELASNCSDIEFSVGVGREEKQEFRGPALRNFFEHSCHGLDPTEDSWDFGQSVDANKTFMVTLRIAPKSCK